MKKVLIIIFTIISFISFSSVHAQVQTPLDGVTISNYPDLPSEGADVTVTIESYLIDLDSSSIVWVVNGVPISHGIGLKEFHTIAPKTGNVINVTSIIKTSNGQEIRKSISMKSGSVDIVWESDGYTPPFYKGKNQFIYQNSIKLIAIPHLSLNGKTEINPKDLVYKWKNGGQYIDNTSGYGVQSVVINTGTIPKPLDISVDVYSLDQSARTSGKITLQPTGPSINFYEMDPLYGILLNKSIQNKYNLSSSEISIFAVPFGFNYSGKTSPLNFTWSINNIEQPDLIKNQNITLKTKGDTDGSSNIDISIDNPIRILQGIRSSLTINFKKKIDQSNSVF